MVSLAKCVEVRDSDVFQYLHGVLLWYSKLVVRDVCRCIVLMYPGLEQYAICAFAEALEAIPQVLAENAGIKAKNMVSVLYAAHAQGNATAGVDINVETPTTVDANTAKIWDNFATKKWGLRFATNAACTVLRVDQIIMAKKAGGPKPPSQGGPQKGEHLDDE